MPINKKNLMGGDKMRPGGTRTLQDEIDMGLRNKDGSLKSEEQKNEETVAQEPTQEAQPEVEAPSEEAVSEQPSDPVGEEQLADGQELPKESE